MFEGYELSNITVRAGDLPAGGKSGAGFMTATVVESGGGKAVLNLDGKQVTVKTNQDLSPGSQYKVMVKGISGGQVQLQVVSGATSGARNAGASAGAGKASQAAARELTNADIPSRLMGFDLPDHQATTRLARGLMNAGLPVTKDTMESLLRAAPQNISDKQIDYLMSLVKAGVEPTRESLNLLPALEREIAALPKNMQTAFDLIAKNPEFAGKLADRAAKGDASARLAQLDLRSVLLAPDTDAPPAAADKLLAIGRQFLTTSESRLMFLDAFAPALAGSAETFESLINRLDSLVRLIPENTDAHNTALDQSTRNVIEYMRSLPEPAEPRVAAEFNAARQELTARLEQAMDLPDAQNKYSAIRQLSAEAMARFVEILRGAEAPDNKPPPFQALEQFPQAMENLIATVQALAQAQPQGDATPQFIARLAADLAPLMAMRFNTGLFSNTGQFLNNAAQLLQDALADQGRAQQDAGQQATLSQRVQMLAEHAASTALHQETELLANQLRSAADLRAALSTLAQNAQAQQDPANAAMNLARGLQYATLSNLVAHNGAAPTDAFVTFFPIQVGGKVEIGKLKIYKNREGKGRRGSDKEVDPDNASLVIILDTEFIGLSMISINTFERNLRCNIRVQHNRIKKILDKHMEELKQGLVNTPYSLEAVSVTVQTRKQRKEAQQAMPSTPSITTIDMEI